MAWRRSGQNTTRFIDAVMGFLKILELFVNDGGMEVRAEGPLTSYADTVSTHKIFFQQAPPDDDILEGRAERVIWNLPWAQGTM